MPTLSREWKREKHKIQMNVYTVLFGQGVRKTVFIGKNKLHGTPASAVAVCNEGSIQLSQVMERLARSTTCLWMRWIGRGCIKPT